MIRDRTDVIALVTARSRRAALAARAGGCLALAHVTQIDDATVLAQTTRKPKRKKTSPWPKPRQCRKRCCQRVSRCRNGVCRGPAPKPPTTGGSPVRYDLHSRAAIDPQLTRLAYGIGVMEARDPEDPTSWWFQIELHQQQAQHNVYHFLPWHRMYLNSFERILQEAAGVSPLVLPNWNPDIPARRVLPLLFRAPGTPLSLAERNAEVNNGVQSADAEIIDSQDAMNRTQFDHRGWISGFGANGESGGALEFSRHDLVHGWVGGSNGAMAYPQTSPRDPIFWFHQANSDRLLEAWLRQPNRRNPTSAPVFMHTGFSFYDRGGVPVQTTGSHVLDVVRDLSYRYADSPAAENTMAASMRSSSLTAAAGRHHHWETAARISLATGDAGTPRPDRGRPGRTTPRWGRDRPPPGRAIAL